MELAATLPLAAKPGRRDIPVALDGPFGLDACRVSATALHRMPRKISKLFLQPCLLRLGKPGAPPCSFHILSGRRFQAAETEIQIVVVQVGFWKFNVLEASPSAPAKSSINLPAG